MKQIELREGAKRQHRALALLGALQCWVRGLDGIEFDRPPLERLLGLERFKETRVSWLEEDIRDLFPGIKIFVTEQNKSISTLLATRKHLPQSLGNLGEYRRWCEKQGIKVAPFSIWPAPRKDPNTSGIEALEPFFGHSINSDERLLTSYLTLIASGQMSALDVPKIKP